MSLLCWAFGHRPEHVTGRLFTYCARRGCRRVMNVWTAR